MTITIEKVAAFLSATSPEKILAYRELLDGALVVVVSPGPKFTFLPDEVENARAILAKIEFGKKQAAASANNGSNALAESRTLGTTGGGALPAAHFKRKSKQKRKRDGMIE